MDEDLIKGALGSILTLLIGVAVFVGKWLRSKASGDESSKSAVPTTNVTVTSSAQQSDHSAIGNMEYMRREVERETLRRELMQEESIRVVRDQQSQMLAAQQQAAKSLEMIGTVLQAFELHVKEDEHIQAKLVDAVERQLLYAETVTHKLNQVIDIVKRGSDE